MRSTIIYKTTCRNNTLIYLKLNFIYWKVQEDSVLATNSTKSIKYCFI